MKKSILRQACGKIIVIVGPNASGKSELGVRLARKIDGEIISADSRQVYRGLDIGSGKVPRENSKFKNQNEKIQSKIQNHYYYKSIRHHCLDIADPKTVFTANNYKTCAQAAIADILSRGKTPIIVGGTGFYIDAALGRAKLGGAPPNPKLRKRLSKKSAAELLKMLQKLDPKRAKTIEQKNPRRLIRAIEIVLKPLSLRPPSPFVRGKGVKGETNDSLNWFFAIFGMVPDHAFAREGQKCAKPSELSAGGARMSEENALVSPSNIYWLGIKRPPEELKKRIHARLIKRLPGIIREVKKLRQGGLSWKRLYDLGLEYHYASLYLRGKLDYKLMTTQLQTATWHYAKRQMTWFKKNKEIRWVKREQEALGLKLL